MIPVVMEERLTQIGNWLRPNGEAIYGTTALKRPVQWSAGSLPHLQQKEFRAPYDISELVDNPQPGYAHIEAFFTQKDNNNYAILPRWPQGEIALHGFSASSSAKANLLGSEREISAQTRGRDLVLTIPESLQASQPSQDAYVIRLKGVHESTE
jgi:alpha-L-fucosidase